MTLQKVVIALVVFTFVQEVALSSHGPCRHAVLHGTTQGTLFERLFSKLYFQHILLCFIHHKQEKKNSPKTENVQQKRV